ncbi:Nif3-like dinuclear metal center hexameric protein [Candidatus Woesearchaeota archaeon]|nr:Nif3-like dinuclear metal center hexameric protein [Candidatus Woesearchaeota archaeon]
MKETTVNKVGKTLDDFLSYRTYNPDSMVTIVNMLDPVATKRFSEEYLGNKTGLMQVNGSVVDGVYCAVFPSEDVFDYLATENIADAVLFVKHAMEWEELGHGFVPLKNEQLELLKDRKISLYSAHAPIDNNKTFAPSVCFARQLGYDIVDELAEKCRNYGWVLEVPQGTTYDKLHQRLLRATGLNGIQRYYHHDPVRRIAVTAGGGDYIPALEQSLSKGCDTYVTGILFFRGSDYARENNPIFVERLKKGGLNGFGASHYLSEVEGIKTLAGLLNSILPVPVRFIEEQNKRNNLEENWGLEL